MPKIKVELTMFNFILLCTYSNRHNKKYGKIKNKK